MPDHPAATSPFAVIWAGRTDYQDAYDLQQHHHAAVLAARESAPPSSQLGRIILTEHNPVITVTRRPGVSDHVLFPQNALAARGVALHETDRGGDVTYHGPGQLVCYPIVDLNRLGLRIHEYMRALEDAVIATLGAFDIPARRDPGATGVWIDPPHTPHAAPAKVCAMGVRVRRWISMHGLAVNIDPNMDHFGLIVPCGLAGRPVTSLRQIKGDACPSMDRVASVLAGELSRVLLEPHAP